MRTLKFLVFFLLIVSAVVAQTKKNPPIEILNADSYKFRKIGNSDNVQLLKGNVKIKQGNEIYIQCDSLNEYKKPVHVMYIYKHVKVKYGKETTITSDYMEYYPDDGRAIFEGNVVLYKDKSKLSTSKATYNKAQDLFVYTQYGKLIDEKMTLTSHKGGIFNGKTKLSTFYDKVHLVDTASDVTADSLRYDADNNKLYLIAPSVIVEHATGRTLMASKGYLSSGKKSDKSFLTNKAKIFDSTFSTTADTIIYYKNKKLSYLLGRAEFYDSTNNVLVKGDSIVVDNLEGKFTAMKNPRIYIYRNPTNPFVLRADSIFSNKYLNDPDHANSFIPISISEKKEKTRQEVVSQHIGSIDGSSTMPNDDKPLQKNDMFNVQDEGYASTKTKAVVTTPVHRFKKDDRYFIAYYNVRMYSDTIQMYCDSLYYSSVDSIARMMDQPVLWLNDNEMKGKTILAHIKNKTIDVVHIAEKSFVLNQEYDSLYTQARAKTLTYYVSPDKVGEDSIVLDKNTEMAYFVKDSSGAYISFDRTSSEYAVIYLDKNKQMSQTRFLGNYKGTHYPPSAIPLDELYLDGFQSMQNIRPTSIEYIESYIDTVKLMLKNKLNTKSSSKQQRKKITATQRPNTNPIKDSVNTNPVPRMVDTKSPSKDTSKKDSVAPLRQPIKGKQDSIKPKEQKDIETPRSLQRMERKEDSTKSKLEKNIQETAKGRIATDTIVSGKTKKP